MKKLFLNLFVLSALIVSTSCSKDDDGNGENNGATQTAKVTIDGVQKTYDLRIVQESTTGFGTPNEPALIVTLSNSTAPTEILNFVVTKGEVGSNIFDETYYSNNGDTFEYSTGEGVVVVGQAPNPANVTSIVEINTATRLKGTFSGTLSNYNSNNTYDTVVLTAGTFDFTF